MEKIEIEERVKAKFEESYMKQMRLARWILLSMFGLFGVMFLVAGIVCLSLRLVDTDGFPLGIFFTVFGAIFIVLGIIMAIAVTKTKINYEKFIERTNKYGAKNVVLLSAIIDVQKEQIEELEERIESLERKLK